MVAPMGSTETACEASYHTSAVGRGHEGQPRRETSSLATLVQLASHLTLLLQDAVMLAKALARWPERTLALNSGTGLNAEREKRRRPP